MARIRIPLSGMYSPVEPYDPVTASGKFKLLQNWEVNNGVLRLVNGWDLAPNSRTGTSSVQLFIYPFEGNNQAGPDYNDYYILYTALTGTNTFNLYSWFSQNGAVNDIGAVSTQGMAVYVPVGGWREYIVVCTNGGSWAYKLSADSLRELGVDAPGTPPSGTPGTGTGLTGTYSLVCTRVNTDGNESNPSTASGDVAPSNQDIVWTLPGEGSAEEYAKYPYLRLYRTVAGGSAYLYLTQIANTAATQTTYTDSIADIALGDEAEYDNDPPPNSVDDMVCSPNRIYLLQNNKVYASKFHSDTGNPNIDAYPSDWAVSVVGGGPYWREPAYAIKLLGERLFVFTGVHVAEISGAIGVNPQVNKVHDFGIVSTGSVCNVSQTKAHPEMVAMMCSDKRIRIWDGQSQPVDISEDVAYLLSNYFYYAVGTPTRILHDPVNDRIIVQLNRVRDNSTGRMLIYNFGSGWSISDHEFYQIVWNPVKQCINAMTTATNEFYELTGFTDPDGDYFTTQVAEWFPIRFGEKAVYVARVGFRVKAQPIVSGIPPMLKIEWAVNGSTLTETKWVDLSKDALANAFTGQHLTVPVYIPINQNVTDVTLRVTACANSATVNGMEIYDVWADVETGEDVHEKGSKQLDKGALAGS